MSLLALASISSQAGRTLGVTGLVLLVIGIALVAMARLARRRRAEFDARAAAVPAEVVDNVWHAGGGAGPNMSVSLMAFPVLRYRLPDGTVVEQESFEGSSPPSARKGSIVTVLYDPADPRRVRIARASMLPTVVATFGAIFAGVGSLMIVGGLALLVA
jgi:hypothetical protein